MHNFAENPFHNSEFLNTFFLFAEKFGSSAWFWTWEDFWEEDDEKSDHIYIVSCDGWTYDKFNQNINYSHS